IYGNLSLDNTYREVAGRFNADRLTDIFLYNSTQTKELYETLNADSRTVMDWGWQGSTRIATRSPSARPDVYQVADFNGDGRSDVLAFNGQRLVLYLNVNGTLQRTWTSGDWVGGWRVGTDNHILVGDFTGDGKADIFIRSPLWAGLLRSNGTSFTNVW